MVGPSPQPAPKGALLPGVIIKEGNHTPRGEVIEGGQSVPFIHSIVNIHGLYYMCFSLVFACLSVSQSRGWSSGASPCYTSQTTFLPTLETEPKEAWSPSSEGTSRQGCSTLAPESSMCVWVCICMYVQGEPVCKYVQGEGVVTVCSRQGLNGQLAYK